MFKKITKKIINNTKKTIKKEITASIENNIPKIIWVITVGFAVISILNEDSKTMDEGKVIINNYYDHRNIYIYYNENKS